MNKSASRAASLGAKQLVLIALLVVAVSVALAACGGSSTSSSSTTEATTGSSEESTEPTESSGGESSGVKEAAAAIAPYEKPVTSIGVTEPLKEVPTGVTIDYPQCEVIECTSIGDYLEEAVAAMGVKLVRINAGNTPDTISKAMTTVVQNKPAAVLVPALDPAIYPQQIKELEAAHIPVVDWTNPEEPEGPIVANLITEAEYDHNGQLMADYAIAKSEGTANVLYVTVPEFTVFKGQAKAFEEQMAKDCPSCASSTISVTAAELGKGAPGQIVSYIQKNPETNWVVGAFGSVAIGVPEALKGAGIEGTEILTQAGVPPNFQYIKEGQQTADLALDKRILAWKALDTAARAITGQSLAADEANPVPIEFLTQEKITFNPEDDFTMIANYKEQFEKLWGVNGK